jgi:uncharacterized membrane protein
LSSSDQGSGRPGILLLPIAAAAVFFLVYTGTAWLRWANFGYRTFDLAYYVQAVWQLLRGRFDVSVEHVPLLGEPRGSRLSC